MFTFIQELWSSTGPQAEAMALVTTACVMWNHLHWKAVLPPPELKRPPDRDKTILWQYQVPPPPPREPPFSYPTKAGASLYSHCCLVAMWFYNMCLRAYHLGWHHWQKATTKLIIPRDKASWKVPFKDTFDKDNPCPPKAKPKPKPRSRLQLKLVAGMALLTQAAGAGQVFQTRSELRYRQQIRKYRACPGILDTTSINGRDLYALQQQVQATNAVFQTAVNQSNHAFSAIMDSGCSESCTPNLNDFIPGTLRKLDKPISLGGIAGALPVTHSGMVHWETVDDHGDIVEFKTEAFYHPDLPGRLFSPQVYLDRHKKGQDEEFSIQGGQSVWRVNGKTKITVPYDGSFLPRITLFHAGKATQTLSALQSVIQESNQNMTPLQKVWMRWHIKLGHLSFAHVLKLGLGGFLDKHALGLERNPLLGQPKCASCQFGKQVRKPDHTTITVKHPDSTGALKAGQLQPGQRVFTDQLESRVRGRLLHTAGREQESDKFCGSSVFVDAASGYIHIEHQVSLSATDSINAKTSFERMAKEVGVIVEQYHTDNGIYKSKAYVQELIDNQQSIRYSGVGAKWQAGVAEGAIRIVVSRARTLMIHAALHWPEEEDETLWPLALSHAAHLYNHTPSDINGIAPIEVFTKTLSDHQALRNAHTWGSPLYVLEPRLTSAGGKIPKWQPRSRRGQYVGVSPKHAENIAVVRNLRTGYLSPQYHVVHDDEFETVYSDQDLDPAKWEDMCIFQRFETVFDEGTPPRLQDEWLTKEEADRSKFARGDSMPEATRKRLYQDLLTKDTREDMAYKPPSPTHPREAPLIQRPREPPDGRKESSLLPREPQGTPREPPASKGAPMAPTTPLRRNPSRTAKHKGISRLSPTMDSRKSYDPPKPMDAAQAMLVSIEKRFGLNRSTTLTSSLLLAAQELGRDPETGLQEDCHPALLQSFRALAGKRNDPDLPSIRESLTGPYAEEFWKAMDSEIASLQSKDSWEVVDRSSMPPGMKAVPGTWAQRIKRKPSGELNKFKSRWNCRGDLQPSEGLETYSPLVGWPTVRAAMLLAATHGWQSRQVDFCNAFLQSDQPEDQPLYLELPQFYRPIGYEDRDVVLRMKKSIYGQVNSPKLFYEHLCRGMTQLGFEATQSDPCLFIHKEHKIMVLNYCDDQIWLSPDNSLIESYVKQLQDLKYDLTLEEEGGLFDFLGINFATEGSKIVLTQTGLIEKVIKYTGMDNASDKDTPAACDPLGSDKTGEPFNEEWSYRSAAGMLLYICSNTRPDLQFSVHQVCRFSHDPRKSHGQALKRIIRYLVKTRTKGLEFVPNMKEGLDCYVDASFCDLHGHEDEQDPVSVRSRTGFTLTLFGCPILWSSKLQTEQTLSSTAAEYVAFSMAMREVLPMRALLQEIRSKIELNCSTTTLIRSTVFEDNQGCISLVNVPKMSTRNKYLSLKYHFFRSKIGEKQGIIAKYIKTTEQKADIFTKGLPPAQFEVIRKLLMGW